jgi:hypothetical protein
MLKKTMLLAASVAALTALVAPAAANATAKSFTHSGAALTQNAEITATGTSAFTSSAGGISCPTVGKATLEPGSTGKITEFKPTDTSKCTYSGNLDNLCGTVDTHASTGLPWTIHSTKTAGGAYVLNVTGVHVDVGGTGFFCPDVTVNGEATLTVDNREAVTSFTLSGTLKSNLGTEVTAEGSASVSPSGTYGSEA